MGQRTVSDRFVKGTGAVLLVNGTLWTGNEGGQEIIQSGCVLLENGLIKSVGRSREEVLKSFGGGKDVEEINLGGSWVTPGIVDVSSTPSFLLSLSALFARSI